MHKISFMFLNPLFTNIVPNVTSAPTVRSLVFLFIFFFMFFFFTQTAHKKKVRNCVNMKVNMDKKKQINLTPN